MDALQEFNSRSHNNDLIERYFIEDILREEGENIAAAQKRVLKNSDDPRIDLIESSRSFSVSNQTLKHNHNIQQRFVDMKKTRYGKQKPIKVHNTILYGHFNNIIFRVSQTLSDALRAQIAQQLKIEMHG